MSERRIHEVDPERDLLLQRRVPVPRHLVWAAWTEPEHLVRWFAPAPFTTPHCDIDLRPGGVFRTVMRSPQGHENTSTACYLEVVDCVRLVWTTALAPGFRPITEPPPLIFTAVIELETVEDGTKYSALAMHGNPASRHRHEELGFHDGWNTALEQLVALFI